MGHARTRSAGTAPYRAVRLRAAGKSQDGSQVAKTADRRLSRNGRVETPDTHTTVAAAAAAIIDLAIKLIA